MKLPDDMFKQELLTYLTVHDTARLDIACMNHEYRSQLMEKISDVILIGDKDGYFMKASLFNWLGMRRIFLINMKIVMYDFYPASSISKNDHVDQFKYTQHIVIRGTISDDMAIFIISHCPCLVSIDIDNYCTPNPKITDHTLQSMAEHCTGLQTLSLSYFREITDAGLIAISVHCPYLKSLKINNCDHITDASIISISTYCTGLQSLNLRWCTQITDASIISISTHCTGLQSLYLGNCHQITDASIISISSHCIGLHSLDLDCCRQITDTSIISISTHCTGLQS